MITKLFWEGIDAIVLDAVGTVIEPFPTVADVYLATAARHGVALDRSEVRARFHRHFRNDEVDEARGALVTDEALEFERWRRIVGNVLPELSDPESAFAELWTYFARPDAWRCFPDVGPAVRGFLDAGLPVRIASNFDARLRNVVAGLPEIAGLRTSLVISSEVGYRKPHPAFYLAACESLGLPPGRVLFVGDDPENDVAGPTRAGLRAMRLNRGHPPGPDPTSVPDLATLLASRLGLGKTDRSDR